MHKRTRDLKSPDEFPSPIPLSRVSIRSALAARVAEMFGIAPLLAKAPDPPTRSPAAPAIELVQQLIPSPGEIVLITGASGAGKSSLLRAIQNASSLNSGVRWFDLDEIEFSDVPVVNCFPDISIERSLEMLSRVGLAEVWTYLRYPRELSEGQRWRLRVACALAKPARQKRNAPRTILACDEFAAILDRITARIVARCLRRAIDSMGSKRRSAGRPSAIVATSHEDLAEALLPDRIIRCDFSRIQIERRATSRPADRTSEARSPAPAPPGSPG